MNEHDKELIDKYLRYIRKRRIIILFLIFICIFLLIIFLNKSGYMLKEANINEILNIQEENIINESTINTTEKNTFQEVLEDANKSQNTNENIIKNTQEKTQVNNTETSNKKIEENHINKPTNKDFLFVDGYTMENVTQVAQEYLESSGYAGKCTPIQDDEGIYLGMRVIFY